MDPTTRKMKLDVESNNVKATTGNFTNLVVNNVQIDSSSLEQYKSLRNDLNDVSARLSGTSPAMTYSASYVNENLSNDSVSEVDFTSFFQMGDFTKHVMENCSLSSLYSKHIYIRINGVKIPLQLAPETFNNEINFVVFYDHILTNWNNIERIYVRLGENKTDGSVIALSSPISKKIKLSN